MHVGVKAVTLINDGVDDVSIGSTLVNVTTVSVISLASFGENKDYDSALLPCMVEVVTGGHVNTGVVSNEEGCAMEIRADISDLDCTSISVSTFPLFGKY